MSLLFSCELKLKIRVLVHFENKLPRTPYFSTLSNKILGTKAVNEFKNLIKNYFHPLRRKIPGHSTTSESARITKRKTTYEKNHIAPKINGNKPNLSL